MSGSFELLILNDKFNEKPYYIGYNTGKGLAHTAPKRKKKSHLGQFIFSTHNVFHLELKTFMKEQIYFVTKIRDSLNSELYSLSDFPEVRYETTKIYEFYMKGILGGTALE